MKRILNFIWILFCCLLSQVILKVNANTITFESIVEQKLDVRSIQGNYFDISSLLSSYTDINITAGKVEFSFVDDIDPLRYWSNTGDYQLKRLETFNRSSNWQLFYERDISHFFSDDEYEYYYARILGDSAYGGNVQRNDYNLFISYDYSLFNYNAYLDDKHYYTNNYEHKFGSYGDYLLSIDLKHTSLSAIDDSGIIKYEMAVYGSDAIFKSALLSLEFTGQEVVVSEPTSIGLFIIMGVGLLLTDRKNKKPSLAY